MVGFEKVLVGFSTSLVEEGLTDGDGSVVELLGAGGAGLLGPWLLGPARGNVEDLEALMHFRQSRRQFQL